MQAPLSKARLRLARRLNRFVLGPIGGQQTFVRSLDEVSFRPSIARHLLAREVMFEARIVRYPFPDRYPPHFRRVKAFDERLIYLLQDVTISPFSGQVWTPEGLLLEESVGSLRRILTWGATVHEPLVPARFLEHPRPVVACAPTGYFHWLLEVVPAFLKALQVYPDADVLLPPDAPPYIADALGEILGGEVWSRVIVTDRPVRAQRVVVPSIDTYSGFVRSEETALLREAFVQPIPHSGERIYVSRSSAPKRRLDNEADLEAELANIGFKVVHMERLSFQEQIATFGPASTIVAPHGAGLANLVWAVPGTRVVEVFPANMFNDCYARLAIGLGLDYDYVTCAPGNRSGVIPVAQVLQRLEDQGVS